MTKANRKELEMQYGKVLLLGDHLHLSVDGGVKPNLVMNKIYRDLANELGGRVEYQYEQTTINDWRVLR